MAPSVPFKGDPKNLPSFMGETKTKKRTKERLQKDQENAERKKKREEGNE